MKNGGPTPKQLFSASVPVVIRTSRGKKLAGIKIVSLHGWLAFFSPQQVTNPRPKLLPKY
jgi:hypothetical protein